jgi:DNA replication protein DnaC
MNCSIYNNLDAMTPKIAEYTRHARQYPIGPERNKAVEGLPWIVYCDGQFHVKTRGGWGVDVALCKCPKHTGVEMVQAAQAASVEKEAVMTWDTYSDHSGDGKKLRDWVDSDIQTIMLYSGTGRGKTHLCKAVQFELVEKGLTVEYIKAKRLAELFMESHPMRKEDLHLHHDAKRRLNRLNTAEYVIIDDLGDESQKAVTDTFKMGLKALLDDMRGRLIVTTNWMISPANTLGNIGVYGDRIYSRIVAGATMIGLKGEDYRLKEKWRKK